MSRSWARRLESDLRAAREANTEAEATRSAGAREAVGRVSLWGRLDGKKIFRAAQTHEAEALMEAVWLVEMKYWCHTVCKLASHAMNNM